MEDLTNDQKYILTAMYKYYLELQPALSPNEANYFQDSNMVQKQFSPQFSKEYVSDICWNLKSKGYISCERGDNLANNISLDDKTIIFMENLFQRNLRKITTFLKSVIEIVK